MALKETIANLEHLRSKGITVQYHCADVVDGKAVARTVETLDGIDGVIHAAGVEESMLLARKSLDSFNRVFDTKIKGARNLLDALAGKDYRFFLAFSSVTAKFGNEGQIDYTAANDMLAKMLLREKAQHPDRAVKVFDWTAWDGAGMATRETVKKVLVQRGLEFLPLSRGVAFFMDELHDHRAVEAVFTGRDTALDPDGLFAAETAGTGAERRPFLDVAIEKQALRATYSRVLDLKRDLFLLDHARLGVPIFLGATGIETMAEAAATLAPEGSRLVSLADFSIPYGIKLLKGRPKEITVTAEQRGDAAAVYDCRIASQFQTRDGVAVGDPKCHYQATVTFSEKGPDSLKTTLPAFKRVRYDGNIQELLYHPSRLFMDGLFRTVTDILSFEPQMLISKVCNSSRKEFFSGVASPDFITDVAIVDAMFQTGGMLEVMTTNEIVLPSSIRKMTFYRPVKKHADYICITRKTDAGREANTYQLELVDPDGRLLIAIEDFSMVKVDRLAPEHRITDRLRPAAFQKAS